MALQQFASARAQQQIAFCAHWTHSHARPLCMGRAPSQNPAFSFATRHVLRAPGAKRQGRWTNITCAAMSLTGSSNLDAEADQSKASAPLLARFRAIAFCLWTYILAVPLFTVMAIMAPVVAVADKYRRAAQHFVNNIWAKASTTPFYSVEIAGAENLPPDDVPVVFVANHQSFLDIYSLFHLNRSFKFISKTSVFLIPIIGWSMFLTGHVMLNRVDRRSQIKCLQDCANLLSNGASVLFFPEGTRSTDFKIAEFKKGAFTVAVKAGVPVVPITIQGTGALMTNGREYELNPGGVKLQVHPLIETKGRTADNVCTEAFIKVASGLPRELVPKEVMPKAMLADASLDSKAL